MFLDLLSPSLMMKRSRRLRLYDLRDEIKKKLTEKARKHELEKKRNNALSYKEKYSTPLHTFR